MDVHGQPACEELGTLALDSLNCVSLSTAFICGGTGSGRRPDASDGDWVPQGVGITESSMRGR
jgi:hypothetical protein